MHNNKLVVAYVCGIFYRFEKSVAYVGSDFKAVDNETQFIFAFAIEVLCNLLAIDVVIDAVESNAKESESLQPRDRISDRLLLRHRYWSQNLNLIALW